MSKSTTNLGLYKIDVATDGESTFNIDTVLNDNWDKIDVKVKAIDDKVVTVPVTKINDKTGDVVLTAADIKTTSGVTVESSLAESVNHTLANITYYVATTGSDTTGDGTSGLPFKTIQYAINKLPQVINHTVTINVSAGNYAETPTLNGFIGVGSILLQGGSALNDTYIVQNIIINNNIALINIIGFKCSSATAPPILAATNLNLFIRFIKSDVSAPGQAGISISNGLATVLNCLISNRSNALAAGQLATVASRDWTAGAGNVAGLFSNYAATIGKSGIQPQGTTSEVVINGGVIR